MPPAPDVPPHDDGLEWLREIRRNITSSFQHDQTAIGDYLRQREAALGDRIVRPQPRLVPAKLEQPGLSRYT